MEKSELYRFSSLVPKVKKSIKKYKKTYDIDFLSQLLNANYPKLSPEKFLQPIKIYRFYGDLATIVNPNDVDRDDQISQLNLQLNYKTISKIDITNHLTVHLEDRFAEEYSSIELFIDRLNTLGSSEAHNLAQNLKLSRCQYFIKDNDNNKLKRYFNSQCLKIEEVLTADEMVKYQQMLVKSEQEMERNENTYTWKMKKFFIKKEPYVQYGPIISELVFNKKIANFFLNKDIEEFNYEDVINLMGVSSVEKSRYFEFFQGMIKHFENEECEFPGGFKTFENFYIPCLEKIKNIKFVGENYEEMNLFMTFCIENKFVEKQKEMRLEKRIEEQKKINLERAKLKTKFKKIQNINSNSWKTLCVLYYGNSLIKDKQDEEDEENPEDTSKIFWKNIDQSKVCNYRLIEENEDRKNL